MRKPTENIAAEIAAERQRQVDAEGITLQNDDAYKGFELLRAAGAYMADSDSYPNPGQPPEIWPFDPAMWNPKDYRRDLIRAAALIVAEIERHDRLALIQPMTPERDEDGWWSHPEYLASFDGDEISSEQLEGWLAQHQLETRITCMESEAADEDYQRYMDDGQCDCTAWAVEMQPAPWFLLSIHDTEDGPIAVWGRRA
jgi:hypothetical protein